MAKSRAQKKERKKGKEKRKKKKGGGKQGRTLKTSQRMSSKSN